MLQRISTITHRFLVIMIVLLASAGASPAMTTILVLGDSLAAGLGVEKEQAFPALVEKRARAEGFPVTVINAGVSGDTSAGGKGRIAWLLNRPQIDVLILELGANDGLRGIPPDSTAANLQAILDAARTKFPDIQLVIAGMKLPPNFGQDHNQRFEQVFRDLARQNNARLIPFLLEGVGGVPKFNLPDRIHPNPAGHRIVAENVWNVLRPVLESATAAPATP
jgi:acyl-CoA thioesterase I